MIAETFMLRLERLERLRSGTDEEQANNWAALNVVYADDPIKFINDWGVTHDPRNLDVGLPSAIPFLLFPRQAEFITWLMDHWKRRENGLCEKSRDMGASWLCVAFAVWMWRYRTGAVIGFGSRKEEYVDNSDNQKSIFWKVRAYINSLPRELRPKGYNARCSTYMQTLNPENGASIVGEAGDNIGRGARATIYFVDESAFLEHPEKVDAALSQTTNCKIDVSTPNGFDNPFAQRRHSGVVDVFTFHWTQDPRKNEEWYAKQKRTLDAVILAQEVDIDYNASVSNTFIDGALLTAAMMNGPADVEALGAWIVGVDAAHEGNDKSVVTPRKGRLTLRAAKYAKLDGPALAGAVMAICAELESRPGERVAAIVIELDGPGVSAYDHMRLSDRWADRVVGVHTGARQSDGKNYNLRALLHQNAREHLRTQPCALPNDNDLKVQGASMRYTYRDGVLLMEKKSEYKKRVGRSPDDWDSWVLTHIPGTLIPRPEESFTIPSVVMRL